MHASAYGKTVTISPNVATALAGLASMKAAGYRIVLHAMPGWTFEVESGAGCADAAIAQCVALCKREGRPVAFNAATFQRIEVQA